MTKMLITIKCGNLQNNIEGTYSFNTHGINAMTIFSQAYLEFFTCKEVVDILLEVLKEYPQVNYHVVNREVSWIHISG